MRSALGTKPISDRSRSNSDMNTWFGQISTFMRGTGAINTVPLSHEYITDALMKCVHTDPKLRECVNRAK